MSAFYGNIKNSNRISLIFDKIYHNRAEMDAACATDGIFNNRYVLIDYGQKKTFPFTRVFPTQEEYEAGVKPNVLKYWRVGFVGKDHSNKEDVARGYTMDPGSTYQYTEDMPYDPNAQYFIKRDSLIDSKTLNVGNYVGQTFTVDHLISEYVVNKEIDLKKYNDEFHHTVWQKIWTQTGASDTVVEKYICVAHLDAEAPILNLVVDAPTDMDVPGIKFIATDKNVDGYAVKDTFDFYKMTSALYIKNNNGFVPADEYDITQKYYIMEETIFDADNALKYQQIIDPETRMVTGYTAYETPNLYNIQQATAGASNVYELYNGKYSLTTFSENGVYYVFNALSPNIITEANKDSLYIKQGDYYEKYTPSRIYKEKLVPTENKFTDGFITEEKYNEIISEIVYLDEDGRQVSVYTKQNNPSSITNRTIYYKNLSNNFIIATSTEYSNEKSYYTKEAYDGTICYGEPAQVGAGPHFDQMQSTDLEYMFHVPRGWKFAEKIAFNWNPKGFSPYAPNSTNNRAINRAELLIDKNATSLYPKHMPDCPEAAEYTTIAMYERNANGQAVESAMTYKSAIALEEQPDTKYFDIKLPEIGNVMSDVWDTVYPRGTMTQVNPFPAGVTKLNEYIINEDGTTDGVNQLLTQEGYAKYYRLVPAEAGEISYSKYIELKDQLYIQIVNGGNAEYIKAFEYSPLTKYFNCIETESTKTYNLVDSDIKIYTPVYSELLDGKPAYNLYTFTPTSDGDVRIMFIGNDRTPSDKEYPQTAAEAIRYINHLLGLKDDDDTIENPPRGTVYGLLNGAKTLYGDPADQITGTYTPTTVTSGTFNSKKDSLWVYDSVHKTWSRLPADATFDPNTQYYLINQPGYQPVPTDLADRQDGFISEELFNYLRETGKWPLYTYNESDGSFSRLADNHTYSATTQYYSNLTTLWAYLNDLQDKYPLYQCDWRNNNSNSLGYIKNRPKMIYSAENNKDGYNSTSIANGNLEIHTLWNEVHSLAAT